jgi:hypothetical protein
VYFSKIAEAVDNSSFIKTEIVIEKRRKKEFNGEVLSCQAK